MHAMTKGMTPPGEDGPGEETEVPVAPAPMATVMWIHDGPVCVTVVETPPYAPCGACQCAACRAHDPDRTLEYL